MAKNFHVRTFGDKKVLEKFAQMSGKETVEDIERITEAYARKMAGEAATLAPVKTGALKNSIAKSPRKVHGEDVVWEWGTDLPYGLRQEYEHRSRKGFVRKAIWNNRNKYRDAVRRRITKG